MRAVWGDCQLLTAFDAGVGSGWRAELGEKRIDNYEDLALCLIFKTLGYGVNQSRVMLNSKYSERFV